MSFAKPPPVNPGKQVARQQADARRAALLRANLRRRKEAQRAPEEPEMAESAEKATKPPG